MVCTHSTLAGRKSVMTSNAVWVCERSVDAEVPASFAWQYMTDVRNWNDPPGLIRTKVTSCPSIMQRSAKRIGVQPLFWGGA